MPAWPEIPPSKNHMAREVHALGRVWLGPISTRFRDKESNFAVDPLSILPQITSGTLHTAERCLFSFFVSVFFSKCFFIAQKDNLLQPLDSSYLQQN